MTGRFGFGFICIRKKCMHLQQEFQKGLIMLGA